METNCCRHTQWLCAPQVHLLSPGDSSTSLKTQLLHLFIYMLYPVMFHESRDFILSIFISALSLYMISCLEASRYSIIYEIQRDHWLSEIPVTTGSDLQGNSSYLTPWLAPSMAPWLSLNTWGENFWYIMVGVWVGGKDLCLSQTVPWPSPEALPIFSFRQKRKKVPAQSGPWIWVFLTHKAFLCCSLSCPWVYSPGSFTPHLLYLFLCLNAERALLLQHTHCILATSPVSSLFSHLPQLLHLGAFPF